MEIGLSCGQFISACQMSELDKQFQQTNQLTIIPPLLQLQLALSQWVIFKYLTPFYMMFPGENEILSFLSPLSTKSF